MARLYPIAGHCPWPAPGRQTIGEEKPPVFPRGGWLWVTIVDCYLSVNFSFFQRARGVARDMWMMFTQYTESSDLMFLPFVTAARLFGSP